MVFEYQEQLWTFGKTNKWLLKWHDLVIWHCLGTIISKVVRTKVFTICIWVIILRDIVKRILETARYNIKGFKGFEINAKIVCGPGVSIINCKYISKEYIQLGVLRKLWAKNLNWKFVLHAILLVCGSIVRNDIM